MFWLRRQWTEGSEATIRQMADVRISAAILGVIALLAGTDIVADLGEGAAGPHLFLEGLLMTVAGGWALYLLARLRSLGRRARELDHRLELASAEAEHWREEARGVLLGLGEAIDKQFVRWQLTTAEKEVGLLLLKGLSLKKIAGLRQVSERTVRQQAQVIYRKGGLAGRADLSAFFLEDLLLPPEQE